MGLLRQTAGLLRRATASRSLARSIPSVLPPTTVAPSPRRTFWSAAAAAPPIVPVPVEALELASNSIPHLSPDLLPIILAIVLTAAVASDDSVLPPWTVTDFSSTGKGYGAIASRDIARGEKMIAERPLAIWPRGISAARAAELFEELSELEKAVYMGLARTEQGMEHGVEPDVILGIRATNGFAINLPVEVTGGDGQGDGTKAVSAIFPRIARINHSCRPNSSQAMNFQTLRMEVYALTPIPSSTELTISYAPLILLPRSQRIAYLRQSFGIPTCRCSLCVSSDEEVRASDARREEMGRVSRGIKSGRGDRKGTLEKMERLRVLLHDEGYHGLPEFEDPAITNAYAVYAGMYEQAQRHKSS